MPTTRMSALLACTGTEQKDWNGTERKDWNGTEGLEGMKRNDTPLHPPYTPFHTPYTPCRHPNTHCFLQVSGAGVTGGDSCVVPFQQLTHWSANDLTAANHHSLGTTDLGTGPVCVYVCTWL